MTANKGLGEDLWILLEIALHGALVRCSVQRCLQGRNLGRIDSDPVDEKLAQGVRRSDLIERQSSSNLESVACWDRLPCRFGVHKRTHPLGPGAGGIVDEVGAGEGDETGPVYAAAPI